MMTMLNSTRATAMRMQKANLHSNSRARRSVKNTAGLLSLLGAVSGMTAVGLYYNTPVLSEAVNNQDNQRFKIPRLFHTSIDPHDHRPFEILSQKTINAIFRSGEVAYRFAEPIKGVSGVYVNSLRSNDPVEDHYSVDSIGSTRLIAGVYDGKYNLCWLLVVGYAGFYLFSLKGHIGPQCSILIRRKIPIYVAQHLENLTMTKSVEKVMGALSSAFEELDHHIQQRFLDIFPKNVSKLSAEEIRRAIANRKDQVETRKIIEEAIHGSCASVAYMDGKDVYAANTGDSRSIGTHRTMHCAVCLHPN
jgi:hypothetical protein